MVSEAIVVLVAGSGRDDNELLLALRTLKSHWRGVGARRQAVSPKLLPSILIEGAEPGIIRRTNKNESSRGYHRTADVGGASGRDSLCDQLVNYAKSDSPTELASVQVNGGQMPPRWYLAGVTLLVPKARVLCWSPRGSLGYCGPGSGFHHVSNLAHVHGVHVKGPRRGVYARSAPIRAAIRSGK